MSAPAAMHPPRVTVLSTTHGAAFHLLSPTARALAAQEPNDHRPIPEIWWSIGIDETQDSVYKVRKIVADALDGHELRRRVRVAAIGRHVGDGCNAQTVALVRGFRSPFTLLNDGDDWLKPTAVAQLTYQCIDSNVWWAAGAKERITLDEHGNQASVAPGPDISNLAGHIEVGALYPPDYAYYDNLVAASSLLVRSELLYKVGFRAHANASDTALISYLSLLSPGEVVSDVIVSKVEHPAQKSKVPEFRRLVHDAHDLSLCAAHLHRRADDLFGFTLPKDANEFSFRLHGKDSGLDRAELSPARAVGWGHKLARWFTRRAA